MELCRHAGSGNFISCSSYFVLVPKFSVGFLRVLIETINRRRFGWRCYRNGDRRCDRRQRDRRDYFWVLFSRNTSP